MSPSTVPRKKLVGPVGLVLLAGSFLLAFFLLRPTEVPGNSILEWLDNAVVSEDAGRRLGELDLAYIKAKKTSGDINDADMVRIIQALLLVGRVNDVQQMLEQNPDLEMNADERTLIDLELAAARSPDDLTSLLRTMVQHRQLHGRAVLERAVAFSEQLQEPHLTLELYETLALSVDVQKESVYRQCGQFMAARARPELAARCYQAALAAATDSSVIFDIKLSLLDQLPLRSAEHQTLVDELMNRRDLSVAQLKRLAPALLAVERPDVAYRIYARLALSDNGNAKQWLQNASRWAMAANKPSDAAVFLDSLARQSTGDERKGYLQEITSVLVAAGQSQEALRRKQQQLSEQLASNELSDQALDPELAKGVDLARQLGKPELALKWNTRRLALAPADRTLLALQGELALAVADLPLALETARQAVRAAPDDVQVRERLARVSEWNGMPVEASRQWLWLSQAANQRDESMRRQALREVVRLSSATFQTARAAQALRELTLLESPADDDVLKLVGLYELEGLPVQAANALNDIMVMHGESPFVRRTLALHNYKHKRYADSLDAWEQYSDLFGHSSEALIYRMELLWRMDRPDEAAEIASTLRGTTLLSQASDYQLQLLAEIAWRYDMPWLARLVQPRIQTLQELDMRTLYGRRSLQSLEAQGLDDAALREALNLWQGTGQVYFALSAMQLALKRNDQETFDHFQPASQASAPLLLEPGYWAQLATMRLRNGDVEAARSAYEQALKLDSGYIDASLGLLWLDIANAPPAQLQASLQQYKSLARDEPRLWQAMAVGYLELGAASTSVAWFEKLLDQIDTDYSMLLTYADALEYAGRAADARQVREYTVFQLRPLLAEGVAEEQPLLLRQYARLAARYGSANHNEALVRQLMNEVQSGTLDTQDVIWREDLSISWLMSTQRHEQARIVMTDLHSQRIQSPLWQRLALALNDRDTQTIKAILHSDGPLSLGNHILALRQLGNDREAYAMAQQALRPGAVNPRVSQADRQLIARQYENLRSVLPGYVSGSVQARDIDGVSATVRGLSFRHSLIRYPLGLGIDLAQRDINPNSMNYTEERDPGEVALSLFFGSQRRGGRFTAGLEGDDASRFGSTFWYFQSQDEKRLYAAELAYREKLTNSAELYLGARQNRASATLDASLGRLPFIRLQADATQINTRSTGERFADGLGGQAELGLRGQFGSNSWSASVQAGQISYQRSDVLPAELTLRDTSSPDSILQERAQRLSVGASLSRGGVNDEFPQVTTPRYFLNARLGQVWPSRELGVSVGGGGGIRVLGGDELSFSFTHDAQGVSRGKGTFTSLGIGYRFHFQ